MIELRFHQELYDASAIDEAIAVYEPFASCALVREAGGIVVKIEARPGDEGADPSVVAAELMNYALGKTVEKSRAAAGGAPA